MQQQRRIPMLKASHHINCLKFARYHKTWTVEDWKRVLWSDETKINRIGSDGKVYVWKKQGETVSDRTTTPTVKHGGGKQFDGMGLHGLKRCGDTCRGSGEDESRAVL